MITCEVCKGTGVVTVTRTRWIGGTIEGYESRVTLEIRCDACNGHGAVPAVACDACDAIVPADEAIATVDGEGSICETCYDAEQAAILKAHPELAYLVPWSADGAGPEVA